MDELIELQGEELDFLEEEEDNSHIMQMINTKTGNK